VADYGNVHPDRDGSIHILSEEAMHNHKETGAPLTLELEGSEVKFKLDDYAPEQNSTGHLVRGDWVEFTLVTDRHTKAPKNSRRGLYGLFSLSATAHGKKKKSICSGKRLWSMV